MRLSVVEGDPGYRGPDPPPVAVYVDGVRLSLCHTADEEAGVAWCHAADRDGAIIAHGGRLYEVAVRGRVELRRPEPEPV